MLHYNIGIKMEENNPEICFVTILRQKYVDKYCFEKFENSLKIADAPGILVIR